MRLSAGALIGLASLAFVSLGLPDGLLGVAWPSIRASFALPLDALGALLAAFTAGYVMASFAGGRLLARLGLGALLAASCLATGLSLLGYATVPAWWMVVALGALAGIGAGGIDTGINTYATERHGPGMLNWLHACYGIGAAGGPAIMTMVLAAALPWQRGYAIVALAQLGLAAAFVVTLRAWETQPPTTNEAASHASERAPAPTALGGAPITATLRLPVAWLGIALFFAYTGLELAVGTWAYTVLTEGRGVSMMRAGPWVAYYWVGLTLGRILGAVTLRILSVGTVLRTAVLLLTASLAVFALRLTPGLDLIALVFAGAAAGPIFPSLIATTPARVGEAHAANAIGFQIAAAALGQACVPALLGVTGRRFGLDALALGQVAMAIVVVAIFERLRRAVASRCARETVPAIAAGATSAAA